jgi:hypothetical protein
MVELSAYVLGKPTGTKTVEILLSPNMHPVWSGAAVGAGLFGLYHFGRGLGLFSETSNMESRLQMEPREDAIARPPSLWMMFMNGWRTGPAPVSVGDPSSSLAMSHIAVSGYVPIFL